MTSRLDEISQVFHWRDSSWHRIEWANWLSFRGLPSKEPLPHVTAGEHYFVVCAIENGRLFQIHPHRYLIDANGHIAADNYFGVLSGDEATRYEELNRRHYAYPQAHPLSDIEKQEFDAIRDRLWRSWLPPGAAIRELVRILGALPNKEDGAWHVLVASGLLRTFGHA